VRKQSRQRDRKEQQEVARQSRVNSKRFWSYVRGKSTNRSDIGDLKTTDSQGNTIMVEKYEEKASLFAEYFSSVFTHEKEEKFEELKLSCHIDNMPSIEITEENVLEKLNAVKQINLLDRINCTLEFCLK